MPQRKKLTESDKQDIRNRLKNGESASTLADEYETHVSTIYYYTKGLSPNSPTKRHTHKTPNFIEVPMNTTNKKVAIIITDSKNLATVLGDLWK